MSIEHAPQKQGMSPWAKDQPLTVTVAEFAKAAGMAASTIYAAIARGELSVIRVGRSIRLPRKIMKSLETGE